MESSRPSRFQLLTLLTFCEKFVVVAHQLLQHAGQEKEHTKIIKAGKQNPVPPSFGNLQRRINKSCSDKLLKSHNLPLRWLL